MNRPGRDILATVPPKKPKYFGYNTAAMFCRNFHRIKALFSSEKSGIN